ncbi:MAG: MFS transporter [Anaerolinea sp.]|nr:MFS transporter [Anaerolinea sp.]
MRRRDSQESPMLRAPTAPSKWLTLIATCLGLGMLMIDTFVVNVAFPAIGRDLNASLSTAEWTVTGYVLVSGIFPVAMGRVGDIFGRRRVYISGLALFIAASAAAGLAPSIEALVVARVFQGLGAATMMPGTLAIITQAFPPQQRGLAIGIWGGVSGLGLIAGPILGGLLVRGDEWRWIFWVNIPVGIVGLVLAALFVPESRDEKAARYLDWRGLVTLSAALFLLLFGLNRANDEGWTSPLILGCFALGALLLTAFVLVEQRVKAPLVDLSLFRTPSFVIACLSAGLFSMAVFGSQPFTSLFMQNYLGFSPLKGGLGFIPATALVAVLMPVSGILGQKLGHRMRYIIIAGSVSVGISFLYLLRLDTESKYLDGLLLPFLLRGLGIGLVMSATSYAVVSAMPMAKSGLASGTLTMARNIGTSAGVAIFGAVFLNSVDTNLPSDLDAAGIAPARAEQVMVAARHLSPARTGPEEEVSRRGVVDGFLALSVAGLGIVTLAAASACFIRYRPHASQTVVTTAKPGAAATPNPAES